MDTMREFIVSSSGLAPARRGLGLGWVISVLSGVAILLGARGAEASTCVTTRDCSFNQKCSIKDAKRPFLCHVTVRQLDKKTGQCNIIRSYTECTV